MWSYSVSKSNQVWLWWAIDHLSSSPVAFWFGSREAGNFKRLQKLLAPLNIVMNYVDGNWAYVDNILAEKLTVSKKNTQKIERKHLSLRTWCSRLVRRGIRFSKSDEMHKIAVGYTINTRMFGRNYPLHEFRT
jgi:insertion element IS1 protein InsB